MSFEGQTCVLCGSRPSTRKGDHQPPECLYPSPRRPNLELNKVPACIKCNVAGSRDDEEFKLMFGIFCGEKRPDSDLVTKSLQNTLIKNKRLVAHLARNSRRVYADRGRGILERSVSVWFDGAAYHRVLARLVRGLHWVESSRILPLKAKITTSPVCQLPVGVMPHIRDLAASVPTKWLNDSTVAYKVALYSESGSVWLFEFFGAHQAYAHVSDDDAEQHAAPDGPAGAAKPRRQGRG